jgi:crossover junction endodeoxyribonuclease RuvC
MRILGIDPGLQKTGWGMIHSEGNRLVFLGCGTIKTDLATTTAQRLAEISHALEAIIKEWLPDEAAIEETFVNKNPASALKLGVARGAAMVTPARLGLHVSEYPANLVKKSVVGTGHASKDQIGAMMRVLLPAAGKMGPDAADALAIAICHAHHASSRTLMGGIMAGAAR